MRPWLLLRFVFGIGIIYTVKIRKTAPNLLLSWPKRREAPYSASCHKWRTAICLTIFCHLMNQTILNRKSQKLRCYSYCDCRQIIHWRHPARHQGAVPENEWTGCNGDCEVIQDLALSRWCVVLPQHTKNAAKYRFSIGITVNTAVLFS